MVVPRPRQSEFATTYNHDRPFCVIKDKGGKRRAFSCEATGVDLVIDWNIPGRERDLEVVRGDRAGPGSAPAGIAAWLAWIVLRYLRGRGESLPGSAPSLLLFVVSKGTPHYRQQGWLICRDAPMLVRRGHENRTAPSSGCMNHRRWLVPSGQFPVRPLSSQRLSWRRPGTACRSL
jgi:hypothetical protein